MSRSPLALSVTVSVMSIKVMTGREDDVHEYTVRGLNDARQYSLNRIRRSVTVGLGPTAAWTATVAIVGKEYAAVALIPRDIHRCVHRDLDVGAIEVNGQTGRNELKICWEP